jgi:Tfp pilus assembly protein PilV
MRTRTQRGQGLIEILVGSIVLIALGWLGLDTAAIVLANSANDGLAKSAARAAANQIDQGAAQEAAKKSIDHFAKSGVITSVKMEGNIDYSPKKQVVVKTVMEVKPPVSFLGFETITFHAQAVEPIVGTPADL